jgi:hypothetical protein
VCPPAAGTHTQLPGSWARLGHVALGQKTARNGWPLTSGRSLTRTVSGGWDGWWCTDQVHGGAPGSESRLAGRGGGALVQKTSQHRIGLPPSDTCRRSCRLVSAPPMCEGVLHSTGVLNIRRSYFLPSLLAIDNPAMLYSANRARLTTSVFSSRARSATGAPPC